MGRRRFERDFDYFFKQSFAAAQIAFTVGSERPVDPTVGPQRLGAKRSLKFDMPT